MKKLSKIGAVVFALMVAASVHAQRVDWSKQAAPDVTKAVALYDFFDKKMPLSKKACEADRVNLLINEAKASIAKAEDAATKSAQQKIKEKAETNISIAPVLGRLLCFTSFYKTMYRAYDLTAVDSWRYNVIEVILSDDLTDKQMKTVANIMALPYAKWNQAVLFDSNSSLAASLANSQKQAKALENLVNKKAEREYFELFEKFTTDFATDFSLFGCSKNDELQTVTCK